MEHGSLVNSSMPDVCITAIMGYLPAFPCVWTVRRVNRQWYRCARALRVTTLDCDRLALVKDTKHLLGTLTALGKWWGGRLRRFSVHRFPKKLHGLLDTIQQHCPALTALDFRDCQHLTDSSFSSFVLNYSSTLRSLAVPATRAKGRFLAKLDLHYLDVDACLFMSTKALRACIQRSHNLTVLRISHTRITDATFLGGEWPQLRELRLSHCGTITGAAINHLLESSPELQRLEIAQCQNVTTIAQDAPSLRVLFAERSGLRTLQSCAFPELRECYVAWTKVDGESLATTLRHSPQLQLLDAAGTAIDGAFLKLLPALCPKLSQLRLESCRSIPRESRKRFRAALHGSSIAATLAAPAETHDTSDDEDLGRGTGQAPRKRRRVGLLGYTVPDQDEDDDWQP